MLADAVELSELEKKTLRTIQSVGAFAKLGGIWEGAMKFANQTRPGHLDVHLSLVLDLGLRSDAGRPVKRRIDLSAFVASSGGRPCLTTNASYSIVVCDGPEPASNAVLRKLHFDYEAPSTRNHAEPKPTSHVQICGKFNAYNLDDGYQESQIEHWYPRLEKPRIPVQPTCLALLINWVLMEFPADLGATQILKDPTWRAHVRSAERTVLKPYYKSAADFLTAARNDELSFFEAHLYEVPPSKV
jgi:hypothetical protein